MPDLVSLDDLTDAAIHGILGNTGQRVDLQDYLVCMAFFEPSTRTRLSFEAAALRQGAGVIGFSDAGTTSSAKGETLEDTMRVLSGYADAIVLRHPERGAARRAAAASTVPVINAGDGDGEHPTQTLVDLRTIDENVGLEGATVALIGDLRHGRTTHSLAPALQRFGARCVQVPAPGLDHPDDSIPHATLDEAAATADVLYVTRVQKERGARSSAPIVDKALLERTNSRAFVMHPLPRVDELATDVDDLPAAKYFDQAQNGPAVRQAILAWALGVP